MHRFGQTCREVKVSAKVNRQVDAHVAKVKLELEEIEKKEIEAKVAQPLLSAAPRAFQNPAGAPPASLHSPLSSLPLPLPSALRPPQHSLLAPFSSPSPLPCTFLSPPPASYPCSTPFLFPPPRHPSSLRLSLAIHSLLSLPRSVTPAVAIVLLGDVLLQCSRPLHQANSSASRKNGRLCSACSGRRLQRPGKTLPPLHCRS